MMESATDALDTRQWIAANTNDKAQGAHLLALTAFRRQQLAAHWLLPDGQVAAHTLQGFASGTSFPSLSPRLPEVAWDEREIHDLFGYIPQGHPDLRPLVRTPRWPKDFFPLASSPTPPPQWLPLEPDNPGRLVEGDGVTIMKVGPTHAGIIESGHFIFSIMGENVLYLDLHLFQNHRGVEASLEGLDIAQVAPKVTRICGADTVSHQVNWAMAVERLAGYRVPEPLAWKRLLLMEAERILSHLNDLSQIPAGVGFQVAHQKALALKEQWQRGLKALFYHRFLFDTVRPGWAATPDPGSVASLVHALMRDWRPWRRLVEGHHGFQDRMRGVGVVRRADIERLGGQGVVARASGAAFDARTVMPAYHDFGVVPQTEDSGDVAARFKVRLEEVEMSWRLLLDVAAKLAGTSAIPPWDPPDDLSGETVTFTESPHGLNTHVVRLENGRVARYHVRSATFRNWPLLAAAVPGNAVGDFPLINKSFELCYSCTDR